LLLMAARMSGYRGPLAVLFAAVIEFIHTATLVHDDIIDDAEVRRGRQAVHTRWGNDVTVLLGDFLYIKSMSMALSQDRIELIRLLCDVTLRMIEGEIFQLTRNGVVDISEEEHLDIIRRKTAHLFAGSAKLGGMLGDTTGVQQDALWDYGFNIGVAFQIVDDLLDFTGEEEAVGKPVGADLREGKITLPLIHLRQRDSGAARIVQAAVEARDIDRDDWRTLRTRLVEHGSLDYARRTAEDCVAAAKDALYAFPPGPERDALMALPDYVLTRDR
ncbi:MAG: polyprenyl synthetase family protein, partial [Acidimicrobiia bacterium]|nr:polyprenyl synthetase family protein [Acidimicrobiia bacterium]